MAEPASSPFAASFRSSTAVKKSVSRLTACVEMACATCMDASTFRKASSVTMRPKSAMSSEMGRAAAFSFACHVLTPIFFTSLTLLQSSSVSLTVWAIASMSSAE